MSRWPSRGRRPACRCIASKLTNGYSKHVDRLPADALASYAEVRALLEISPWSGEPVNPDNAAAEVRTHTFGDGLGLVTYLVLEDQRRCTYCR
jgi:hypothetical protein